VARALSNGYTLRADGLILRPDGTVAATRTRMARRYRRRAFGRVEQVDQFVGVLAKADVRRPRCALSYARHAGRGRRVKRGCARAPDDPSRPAPAGASRHKSSDRRSEPPIYECIGSAA
jgi:hypothetical protein